jgi:hypothetical protein
MKGSPIKINITFAVIARSDAFIAAKDQIVSLNEVAAKVRQRIPLITRPISEEII